MKRVLTYSLAASARLALLAAVFVWLVYTGTMPLQDGVQLAGGNVIAVVDDSHQPFPVAAYLFRLQEGGFGLVDAGYDPTAVAIHDALARLGEDRDSVRAIIFAHGHGDHTRGRLAFANADTYRPEQVDLTQVSRPARSLLQRLQSFARPRRRSAGKGISVSRRVSDGELLNTGGTVVEVSARRLGREGRPRGPCTHAAVGIGTGPSSAAAPGMPVTNLKGGLEALWAPSTVRPPDSLSVAPCSVPAPYPTDHPTCRPPDLRTRQARRAAGRASET